MTSFTTIGTSLTRQTLASGEIGFVGVNGTIYTETDAAIDVFGSSRLMIQGTVAAGNVAGLALISAVRLISGVSEMVISVGALGSLSCMKFAVVSGSVSGAFMLSNAGVLYGLGSGVNVSTNDSAALMSITNTGTISSTSGSAVEFSSGSGAIRISNSGTLTSSGAVTVNTTTLLSGGSTVVLTNSGTIENNDDAVFNMVAIRQTGGALRLVNTGLISGDIETGGAADSITNSGTISGSIRMGDGNNVFRSDGGTVLGAVVGGRDLDLFYIDRADIQLVDNSSTDGDGVFSTVSFELPENIEQLELRGAGGLTGIGNAAANALFSQGGGDRLEGRLGVDLLIGKGGDDTLLGGGGADQFNPGEGDDVIHGGGGVDVVYFLLTGEPSSGVTVNLATGLATSAGDGGNDTLSGIENVVGTGGDDVITGSAAANFLTGETGDDRISGGNGNDVLIGGVALDTLSGGNGADVFVYASVQDATIGATIERITDFGQGGADVIDLGAILSGVPSGAFAFVGTAAFTAQGAQVRYVQDVPGGRTLVEVAVAGDAVADMRIELTGLHVLTASDFLL